MSQEYFTTLTVIGEAKHANAVVTGSKVDYATMDIGDGNGVVPIPSRTQTNLVHKVDSFAINTISIDPDNSSQIIVELVIPETEGGWWIRELGIRDAAGDLIAVASVPPSYKPVLLEGSGRNQVIRVVLLVSSTAVVNLKIDPAIVMATRKYVDDIVALPSGVDAGTYGGNDKFPVITVDARGRVIAASEIEVASVWDDIPSVYKGDIINVKGLGQMWWTENAFITGYRSQFCGIVLTTLDRYTRSWTFPLRGGTFNKTLAKYKGLYSFINEQELMVDAADYKDGEGFFCELGGDMVKAPNVDDMFFRAPGTDKDTANARSIGSAQLDAIQNVVAETSGALFSLASNGVTTGSFTGALRATNLAKSSGSIDSGSGPDSYTDLRFDASLVVRTSTETRGQNVTTPLFIAL